MATFRGTTPASHFRLAGYDIYGAPTWGPATTIRVTVVAYKPLTAPSPLRVDTSASHGRLDEMLVTGTALIGPGVAPSRGDKLMVFGSEMLLVSVAPLCRLHDGAITHYECNVAAQA